MAGDSSVRVLDWLLSRFPGRSRTSCRALLKSGRVWVAGKRVMNANEPIPLGTAVEIRPAATGDRRSSGWSSRRAVLPARFSTIPGALERLGVRVIHDDPDVLVVDKPPGLITSSTPRERRPTLFAALRACVLDDPSIRVGLIHRLDADASGLLVFSKTRQAYQHLKTQFYRHKPTREYLAVIDRPIGPDSGSIDFRLLELPDGRVVRTRLRDKGESARTDWRVEKRGTRRTLLRVTLHTGRKHQVRAHLATLNCPIVGDRMYQGTPDPKGLHLRAVRLAFEHPKTRERLDFSLEPPGHFLALD